MLVWCVHTVGDDFPLDTTFTETTSSVYELFRNQHRAEEESSPAASRSNRRDENETPQAEKEARDSRMLRHFPESHLHTNQVTTTHLATASRPR